MTSKVTIILISIVWFICGFFYYPKWIKPQTEATISWDVSGYYHYLPAIFIYKDVKEQKWMDSINDKYLPSAAYDQSFIHEGSGNRVNKYSIGQAVLFTPFFFTAHLFSNISDKYPADGYSRPYQVAIWLGGLIMSILGLLLLRTILLKYFDDSIVAFSILTLALATNWFEYASITNGMSHTWLFTLLCGLILFTIRFYRTQDWMSVFGVGICLGLAGLTRPTELIWVWVPLLWGVKSINGRMQFLRNHWNKLLISALVVTVILSIQVVYWKYVSGDWFVYSYGDQKLDFLHPNFPLGLKGANTGWWLYTPIMFVAFFGYIELYRKDRSIFWPLAVTTFLAVYVTMSWNYWQTGGGLGQRNLIQIYPLMAFPLAYVIKWFMSKRGGNWLWILLLVANVYYTLWWVHQAHKGGFFKAGEMTKEYFLRIAGRLSPEKDNLKLLDTPEYYKGDPAHLVSLQRNSFDADTSSLSISIPSGGRVIRLNAEQQFYGPIDISLTSDCNKWVRLSADFNIQSREWDKWKYTQWIVQFFNGDNLVKSNFIRVQRLMPSDFVNQKIYFDVKIPDQPFTKCSMTIWNAESSNTILIDNFEAACFE